MKTAATSGVVLLMAGALLSYAGAYHHPLVFDDGAVVGAQLGGLPLHRWLSSATFAAATALAGAGVALFRLENVLLHAATAIALFFFCRDLLGRDARERGIATLPALAGAGLFALHPVTVYGVAYLSQRSIVMATLFSVLALHAWLRGLREGGCLWFAGAAALYVLALLSKEHAVMLPAVAAALAVAAPGTQVTARILWRALVAMAAMAAIAVAAAAVMGAVLGAAYEPQLALLAAAGEQLHARSILTQGLLFFRYVLTWLAPLPALMSIDVRWGIAPSLLAAPELAGAIGFLGYGAAAAWLLFAGSRRGLIGFAMLVPWLFYFTEFATVRVQEPFVLYRSYLWGIGLAILAAILNASLSRRALVCVALAGCTLGAIGMRERLATFASPVALWDDAVRKLPAAGAPFADRAIGNRGVALMREGRLAEAMRDFDRAVGLNPQSPVAFYNRAMAHAFLREIPRAQADLAEAQRLQRAAKN